MAGLAACVGKVRHSTYEAAVAAAVKGLEGMKPYTPDVMQPYRCDQCRGWHLTSRPWRNTLGQFPALQR